MRVWEFVSIYERASLTVSGGETNANIGLISDCVVKDPDVAGGATPLGFVGSEHMSCTSLILLDEIMGTSDVEASSNGQRNR
jgi:hypothetical protein